MPFAVRPNCMVHNLVPRSFGSRMELWMRPSSIATSCSSALTTAGPVPKVSLASICLSVQISLRFSSGVNCRKTMVSLGLGKRTYNAYLPCGCKAQLRLNFSYSDKALRITTLNDVHTGHETSRDSYAEVSAKCRRRSSVANPAPSRQLSGVSGANAWSPSVSVYNLHDEYRRSFLMGQHSFPSPFPSVGHQGKRLRVVTWPNPLVFSGLFGLQQRRSSSNGNPTEHSEVLQSGSSATASAAPKRPQHFTISSILGDDAGNDGLAATPPAITGKNGSPLALKLRLS